MRLMFMSARFVLHFRLTCFETLGLVYRLVLTQIVLS